MYISSHYLFTYYVSFSSQPKLSLGGLCRKFLCGYTDCKHKAAKQQDGALEEQVHLLSRAPQG